MENREVRERLNPYEDIDTWVRDFEDAIDKNVDWPENAVFNDKQKFSDWRLSYGVHRVVEKVPVYFLSFYPPFCIRPKASFHYRKLSELASDVLTIENFMSEGVDIKEEGIDAQDIIACVFAITRNKESFELFSEQKDLMMLGLKHFHLDNYYQTIIKELCDEYYEKGTILGKDLPLTLIKSNFNI